MNPFDIKDDEAAPLKGGSSRGWRDENGILARNATARSGRSRLRDNWSIIAIVILLLISIGLVVALAKCGAEKQDTTAALHFADPTTQAAFMVVGDWGRRGEYNQSALADSMAQVARRLPAQFVVSTGDNFYPHGLNSTYDKEFELSFMSVYNHTALQIPWYAVLGNHDYGDGADEDDNKNCLAMDGGCPRSPLYQLDAALIQRDARWHCARLYTQSLGQGLADVFFMDTTPFVHKYRDQLWAAFMGGVQSQSPEAQLRELEARLARSTAQWKILIAHHPVRSNGEHGDTPELLQQIAPLLHKYGVRVAFHGHDHNLEHIHVPGDSVHYFVSGAGSKVREMNGQKDTLFQHAQQGFLTVQLRQSDMVVEAYGLDANKPLYITNIPRKLTEQGF